MPEYVSKEIAAQIAMSYAPPSDVDFDCWRRREKSWEYERCEKIAKAIQNAPAADVRPVVRGKWRLYSPLTDTYECNKCGYQVIDESFCTNFCSNCGADMREADDGLKPCPFCGAKQKLKKLFGTVII